MRVSGGAVSRSSVSAWLLIGVWRVAAITAFLPEEDTTSLIGSLFRIIFDVAVSPNDRASRQKFGYDGNKNCYCQPAYLCQQSSSDLSSGQLDVRIVTPPASKYCSPGYVYCCWNNKQECGTRLLNYLPTNNFARSIGQAPYGAYPWQVLILTKSNVYVGSGALVDPQYVVTVAHKLLPFAGTNALKVRLGEWDAMTNRETFPPVEREISVVTIHPQFEQNGLQNDVAVLKLSAPAVIDDTTPNINTVCLPRAYDSSVGERCWVSGWGKSGYGSGSGYQSIQKEVDVTVLSSTECERLLRQTRLGPFFRFDSYNFLCAGGEKDKDACSGDGGSPLVCERGRGQFYLAGLVAWGIGCGNSQTPGVYVNIPSFVQWINQQTTDYVRHY
nr:PREDICTED: trypsin-like [Bemisia tabaci]